MTEKCYYCDSTDTNYCSLCEHWFCDRGRIRYDKRIKSAIKERFAKIGLEWLTSKEYKERKKEEEELTPEELEAVERAEEDYKAGRFYTHKEVGKMLGLDEEEEK